ncbi:thiamine pyrophosphate-binding protein [Microtetraspora sp. NBRC 16547]|uniref:thiamine pyrophosphate-binding protein n=1 Tax=Microtetraspora sp. NBRC 16547 TaxID=3030993 RepID=UPI0024A3041C|nr:thiamine pyrophosphate-binding protein [Microtetraspora sp. NBRC 16547]GLX00252.1 acetolactate synthase, large subunit, biosynthetic type [Microtetraspora sp. NBRC 16547]
MQVYEALVKGLESAGVDTAFGGNGENIASLTLALRRSRKIRPIMTRHEQAASFMACGYAMYTNRLGVCFATVGPGAFNLFSGLAVALSDSYPVLAITGFVSLDWRGRGAVNDTSGLNRTPDSQAMFAATTKRSYLLTDVADTCDVLEEAVNVAFEGRPGPVHIHVPQNLTNRGVTVDNYHDVGIDVAPVRPDPEQVEMIADVLADALRDGRRVVLLAGFGAIRSHAEAAVLRFVERFQVPLVTTLDGKGAIAETHPLAFGVFSESGHASALKAFREADVVLAVGNSFSQHATFGLRKELFDGKVLIQVNIAASEIGKTYVPERLLVSDACLAIEAITDALERRVGPVRSAPVVGRDDEARRIVRLPGEIHPGQLAQTIGRMLPERGVVLADAGAHLAWLGYYVDLESGQNFRKTGTFGPMSGHVNGAIGVKLAQPDRTVVVGCGDGCYSMAGFELMTAVENDVPVIWVIFNDDEYKIVKLYQLANYGESGLVNFKNPDFAAYARMCGADGYRVKTIEEFEDAFRAALASGRPTVIDAKITRWALPHYSSSPEGTIPGVWEALENRLRHE